MLYRIGRLEAAVINLYIMKFRTTKLIVFMGTTNLTNQTNILCLRLNGVSPIGFAFPFGQRFTIPFGRRTLFRVRKPQAPTGALPFFPCVTSRWSVGLRQVSVVEKTMSPFVFCLSSADEKNIINRETMIPILLTASVDTLPQIPQITQIRLTPILWNEHEFHESNE